ncbi:MAG: hypothetical protein NTW87_08400 [Planctomycetota bacterium]|nr:hypothetical protein [Planctomycetota bacterium]
MRNSFRLAFLPILAVCSCALVFADTLVMKTGQTLECTVVKEEDAFIEVQVEFGTMRVPRDRILRIEEDSPEKIAEREAKATEARDLAERMQDEGKVLYKGKWMTEEEKAKAEQKAAAAKKKRDDERAAAKKKADEAARKKKDDEDRRKQAAQQTANTSNSNIPERAQRYQDRHGTNSSSNSSRYGSSYGSSNSGALNDLFQRGRSMLGY